ncbi:hypothetical protein TNCT_505771 [Trichonephila clavata]|uniref:Uncharacterized protein n=1 Tax=Trichonephila clavata TaxID=2740835 RepID=A0A8X6M6Y7_TRICU|nr:hypothetical protein TNCT_505771 [Trichonephila clavata]
MCRSHGSYHPWHMRDKTTVNLLQVKTLLFIQEVLLWREVVVQASMGLKGLVFGKLGSSPGLELLCPPVLGKQKDSEQMSFVHLSDCDWSLDILVYFSSIVVCTRRVWVDADWFGVRFVDWESI